MGWALVLQMLRHWLICHHPKQKENFSTMTAEVCEPLRRLISVNVVWTLNRSYQEVYWKAKSLVKEERCTKYYNVRKPFCLEMDAPGVGLNTALLQVRDDRSCGYDGSFNTETQWHRISNHLPVSHFFRNPEKAEYHWTRDLWGLLCYNQMKLLFSRCRHHCQELPQATCKIFEWKKH